MQQSGQDSEQKNRQSLFGLLAWLLLVPVVLGLLICFGQLALFISMEIPSALTHSLLRADYGSWPYDEIAPLDLNAFLEDVKREQRRFGQPVIGEVVDAGVYWLPPTPTPGGIALVTAAPPTPTPTPTPLPPTLTPIPATATATVTVTATPTLTLTPQPSATNTRIPIFSTRTPTEAPEEPPPPPSPPPPQPTATFTATSSQPPVQPPTPTYAPVRPIAEDDGISEPFGGGCRAYFGYRNANPQEAVVPVGQPRNYFSTAAVAVEPGQPDTFLIGRIVGAFYVVWNTPGPFTWYLDGAEATANWCK
jgi:hypothetical protein